MTRLAPTLLVLFLAVSLGACVFFRSAEAPLPYEVHAASAPGPAATLPEAEGRPLIIFMPGFADGPEDFVEHGLVDAARELGFVVAATDAHFGYYRDGFQVVERVVADVVRPAVARGYETIWVVGISMGGFGALSLAMAEPEAVTGVVALAPYLGDDDVVDPIIEGGLAGWTPPDDASLDDSEARHTAALWRFFQSYGEGEAGKPRIWLGWGEEDDNGRGCATIGAVLPPERSVVRPGGHKWTVWGPLFAELAPTALAVRR